MPFSRTDLAIELHERTAPHPVATQPQAHMTQNLGC